MTVGLDSQSSHKSVIRGRRQVDMAHPLPEFLLFRPFSAGPRLCNCLPQDVQSASSMTMFRPKLKFHFLSTVIHRHYSAKRLPQWTSKFGSWRVFSAKCNIYISRLCYDVSIRLSVRPFVTEVHWRIIANLGFKFRSHFTAHCGRRAARRAADHLAPC